MGKLGIRGHYTRSDEVIKLLESLGGVNENNLIGHEEDSIYVINNKRIEFCGGKEEVIVFTIDEFFEKFPYKIGDKVLANGYVGERCILEMIWDENTNNVKYGIGVGEWIEKDNLVKKDNLCCEPSNNVILYTEPLEYQKIIWSKTSPLKTELVLGDEYEIINEGGVTYVVRKDPYPKTYKECCKVLGIKEEQILFKTHSAILDVKFKRLYKLYICRNAYWKIANYQGPEAGTEFCWLYYNIYDREIKMEKGKPDCSMFMSFPNEYVADKFIKHFGDLLEDCKEFL